MSSNFLLKSAFWLTVSEIIYNLSGYIIHSAVGRILGPADYGRYGLVVTLTTMVIILIGNGIPTAMSKYLSEIFHSHPEKVQPIKKQALKLQILIISAITLLFFLAAPLIARILGDLSLTNLFRLSTLIIPAFASASFYFYYYTGIHHFNLQSILKTLRSLFRVIAIITLAFFFHVEGSVAGYIVAPLAVFLIAYLIDKFKISSKFPKNSTESFDWKKLANYAWPVTLFMLFYELFISIDLYLVQGILRNEHLTGIYNGALTVARIPYFLFYALTIILLPTISKSTSQNNHQETFSIISSSLRLMLIMLFPAVLLLSFYSSQVLTLFYGATFSEGAAAMSILSVGVGFLTIFYVLSFVMNGAGKVKIPMWISLGGLIFNTALNYILIQKYALLGSASATALASFLIMILMLSCIRQNFAVSIKLASLFKIIAASITTLAALFLLPNSQLLFILSSIVALGIYFAILYTSKEISSQDLQLVKSLLQRKKK